MKLLLVLFRRVILALGLLAIVLAVLLYWLLLTNSGLQTGVKYGRIYLPDSVTFDSIEGELAQQLRVRGVRVKTDAATVELPELVLQWNPQLLRDGMLKLDSLQVTGANILLHESSPQDRAAAVTLPTELALPFGLSVDDVVFTNVQINQGDASYIIDRVSTDLEWVDTALTLTSLSMQSAFTDAEVTGSVTTAGTYPLQLQISSTLKQEFAVPLTGTVTLVATGAITDLAVNGSIEVTGGAMPAVSASYSAQVQANPQDLLDHEVTGHVQLVGKDIATADYVEQLPGRVSIEAEIAVSHNKEQGAAITVPSLSLVGELLDENISLTGAGSWRSDSGQVQELRALWGDYKVSVNGQVGDRSALNWSADLPNLSQAGDLLQQDWHGSVNGSGQLLGSLSTPRLIAQLVARGVSIQGTSVELAAVNADLSTSDTLQLDVLLNDVTLGGEGVDEIEIGLEGKVGDHQLALTLNSARADIVLAASGALKNMTTFEDAIWSFDLSELEVVHPDLSAGQPDHRWQLAQPATGELMSSGFMLEQVCLDHVLPEAGGGVCVGARFASDDRAVNLDVQALGLANLNALLPTDTRLAGELSGGVQWAGELRTVQANMILANVGLALRKDGEWLRVAEFASGTLGVAPSTGANSDALALSVDLPLKSDSAMGVFADVSGSLNEGTLDKIAGSVRAELPELEWLAAFSEQVDTLTGSLVSNVTIGGTLTAPELFGQTVLEFPRVTITEPDIVLLNTQLTLSGTPQGLQLTGSSDSGDGSVSFSSSVTLREEVAVTGNLKGENFAVSSSPEARIAVSPDLTATFTNNKLTLRGDVAVPIARVTLDKVPSGAVTASKDQQFLEQEASVAEFATDVQVRVLLGDDVSFEGLGLNASFGGTLAIRDRSNQVTTATGEIEVIEGTYQAYGQDLSIKNGKLVFAGGPVDVPGLNFRAVRQATPEIEVGVHVQGTLREPTLEVFSTPTLPESDQLSYLVLGRPLSNSSASENSLFQQAAMALGVQGGQLLTDRLGSSLGVDSIGIESAPGTSNAQAALVVGKYLSPRLYVSYGYGLFEPISTLRLEYQLNRLWRIVTESTNTATGGDFLWVYER